MMSTIVEMTGATSVTELVRLVWMELALACLAATVYFSFAGVMVKPGQKEKSKVQKGKNSPRSMCQASDQEPTTHQVIAKALRQGNVTEAIGLLMNLPEITEGFVPANIAPRMLMAAAKSADFDAVVAQMSVLVGKFEARSFEAVAIEAAKNKDMSACRQLQGLAKAMSIPKSTQALASLAKGLASNVDSLRALVEDEDTEVPLAKQFAKAVLEACSALKEVDLAAEVFEKVAECDAASLRLAVERAASAVSTGHENSSKSEYTIQCKEIRMCGKNGDLPGAISIFEQEREGTMTTKMYNSIMDACIECGKIEQAIGYFAEAKGSGLADVISYNTAIKGYLAQDQVAAADRLFAEMSQNGIAPTIASFHTFLNFRVTSQDRAGSWSVVAGMQAAGILPTSTTCSILLKAKIDTPAELRRILAIVDTLEPIDEVLFHTIADACIRTNQLHLLTKYQAKLQSQGNSVALAAPTYGAMMKAHGKSRDVKKVKDLWAEMLHLGVKPTAITLGCMVEALVANWCTADAWKLVQQMRNEEETRPLVNTVIYSTIIKGFANAKECDKVMSLYEEMKSHGIEPNNITYNTVLNAFAQGGAMHRVPALLEDMKSSVPPAEPDMITYSTIIKGFCNSGSLDRALEVLAELKADGKFPPDEVMYNSLLDGCAKEHRPNDALKLLDEMKTSGVVPSNYTLSMLIKLMGRCRKLNQCFTIVEELSLEYGLKLNIQVYTCLIQACFNNRQAAKAVTLHQKMIDEGLCPDEMTYSALVKGCLQASLVDKAVELTKYAHGVGAPQGKTTPPGINSRCLDELCWALGEARSKTLQAELADAKNGGSKGQGKGLSSAPWRKGK